MKCVCVCVWVNYRMLEIIIVASIRFLLLEPKSTQTTLMTHTYYHFIQENSVNVKSLKIILEGLESFLLI